MGAPERSIRVPWPRLASGTLATDDDTFRQMARAYPAVASLHELRHTLGKMKLNRLQVGGDGRNRCLLSPFRSKTGRNQPSNAKFIFGPSAWLRGLIKPKAGNGIAYLDFGSQEIAIAAALSGDDAMMGAYGYDLLPRFSNADEFYIHTVFMFVHIYIANIFLLNYLYLKKKSILRLDQQEVYLKRVLIYY